MVKGGNHCYALFQAETVSTLIVLGARIRLVSSAGEKNLTLEEFFTGDGKKPNLLKPGEILTEVQIPTLPPHTGTAYLKYSLREAIDFAVLGVAVAITQEDGVCKEARVVLGAVDSGPLRSKEAGAILNGKRISDDLLEEAAQTILKEAHPITHMGISAGYKRAIIPVLVKRAVNQALDLAKSA